MQSELKSLSKIFSETIFRIPDYQRGYSWGEKQVKDFWNDIVQLPPGRCHYTGVLTLEPVKESDFSRWEDDFWIIKSKKYSPIYVVDGQQRLTTAVVLMQVILESMSDGDLLNYTDSAEIRKKYIFESKDGGISRSYLFGYEKDNPSYEFLKCVVFGEQSINHSMLEETAYTKNLLSAKNYFKERVEALSFDQKERVFTVLTQGLLFNIFFIERELDVFVTFETMNNRGKGLSHLELLKNRLIYLSTKFDVDLDERSLLRKSVNESWKTVYHYLGKLSSARYSDDVFLMTHFVSYFSSRVFSADDEVTGYRLRSYFRDDGHYKDYLLDEIFTPKRLNEEGAQSLSVSEIFKYAREMKRAVKVFHDLASPADGDWSDDEKVVVSKINRLDEYPLFLLVFSTFYFFKPGPKRLSFLRSIELVGFLSKLRSYFFQQVDPYWDAVKISQGLVGVDELTSRNLNAANLFVSSSEFEEAIRSVGKTTGYYRWGGLRYFMYEYEQALRAKTKSKREFLSWDEYSVESYDEDHRSVEHIYPQKATDPYWRESFSGYLVSQKNLLKNSLGNLLPVSSSKNSALGNKSFDVKKGGRRGSKVGYCYGCLSEIEVSRFEKWGGREILIRGVHLLCFLEKNWGVPLGSVTDKIALLGLGFVLEVEGVSIADIERGVSSFG